jgi:hypothetical protein
MQAYNQRQIIIILWIAKHFHMDKESATKFYIGRFAELFAIKHRHEYILNK